MRQLPMTLLFIPQKIKKTIIIIILRRTSYSIVLSSWEITHQDRISLIYHSLYHHLINIQLCSDQIFFCFHAGIKEKESFHL